MVSLAVAVGLLGNAISLLVYAAPMGTFWKVVKKKSVENCNVLPYVTTLLCKSLWTFYGALDPNGFLLVTVNGLGVLSESIYVILYLIYAPKDRKIAVIKTKSVEYLSFSLSFLLLLNAGCWFTFALILKDFYIIVPNALGILTNSSQIILYIIYKNKSPSSKSMVIDNELSSVHMTKEVTEMQNIDESKMESP